MTAPIVALIAAHGRSGLLERTLSSLADCDRPAALTQVIVVENGGRLGVEAVVRGARCGLDVRYLYHEEPNKSAALNHALEGIQDSWIVFLDDDVRLDPRTLVSYASAIGDRRGGAYLGGPVAADFEERPPDFIYLPYSVRGWSLPAGERCPPDTTFLGANWAAYSEDLRREGGFDTHFGPGAASGARGQESNMQVRLQRRGVLPEYLTGALVWHYVPKDRCSASWSLRRAYQESVGEGLGAAATESPPLLLGYPRWRVRRLLENLFDVARQFITGTASSKYQSQQQLQRTLGFMTGWRLGLRRQRLRRERLR